MLDFYLLNEFNICYLVLIGIIYLYIAYIDFKTSYIWDMHILISVVINIINAVVVGRLMDSAIGGVIAFGLHYFLFLVVKAIYKEERYGMGDVLLMGSIGMMLGVADFCQYQFMQIMITGFLGMFLLMLKGRNWSFPMGPVYVFWLFAYILLGRPDVLGWYFQKVNMLLS